MCGRLSIHAGAFARAGGRTHACGTGTREGREGEWWDGGESEADVGEKLVGAI